MMQTAAIIGAGLLGRTLALLLKDEYQISLFEQHTLHDQTSTGRLAAAMVAPTAESIIASDHIVAMGKQASQLWPALLNRLALPELYQQAGTLVVAHRQDVNELQHFQQRLSTHASQQIQLLNQTQIQHLEPELANQFYQGLYIADEGQVDNKALYLETAAKIRQSNIRLHEHCQAETDSLLAEFDWVIDCRGLGSKQALVDKSASLRGVRGEVVRVSAPEVNLSRPIRIMHPRHPIYIAPKPNNEFIIGATEIESEDDKNPTVRSTLELLSAAYTVHKGFAEGEVLSINSGLRPTLHDNEPKLLQKDRLIQANGLYRHGFLLAPYVLQQILLLVAPSLSLQDTETAPDPVLYRDLS